MLHNVFTIRFVGKRTRHWDRHSHLTQIKCSGTTQHTSNTSRQSRSCRRRLLSWRRTSRCRSYHIQRTSYAQAVRSGQLGRDLPWILIRTSYRRVAQCMAAACPADMRINLLLGRTQAISKRCLQLVPRARQIWENYTNRLPYCRSCQLYLSC